MSLFLNTEKQQQDTIKTKLLSVILSYLLDIPKYEMPQRFVEEEFKLLDKIRMKMQVKICISPWT